MVCNCSGACRNHLREVVPDQLVCYETHIYHFSFNCQQVYLSKDVNGLTAFHKAIVNGHCEIAEHLMEKTDRACFNVSDRQGRTALFHAAVLSEFDDIGMYGWLMNMGYDKNHQDNVSKLCM